MPPTVRDPQQPPPMIREPVPPVQPAPLIRAPRITQVKLNSFPSQSRVFLGGIYKGKTPLLLQGTQLEGDIQVRVERRCYQSWQKRLSLKPGAWVSLTPTLKRQPPTAAPASSRTLGWTFIALGGGVVIASVGLHVAASLRHDDAQTQLALAQKAAKDGTTGSVIQGYYEGFQTAANEGNVMRTIAWIGGGVGAATLLGALVSFLAVPHANKRSQVCP